MAEAIPDDLQSAYAAEEKAEDKLAEERAESVKLHTTWQKQQAKVMKARTPFEATRETRRTLEREYGIGEYAASGAPTQTIGGD
ncbi:hypothetical protein LCGC14_2430400 [marine sediment metagenome]|uniref:Uncharacterized protein n=1 Tax=marine sediment metagenome TaxID=412755 RepID=A0A0F9EG17_9ZZZZ